MRRRQYGAGGRDPDREQHLAQSVDSANGSAETKIILCLNKTDLISEERARELRREHPRPCDKRHEAARGFAGGIYDSISSA